MAAVVTWGVCILLGHVLGACGGAAAVTDSLAGLNTGYPVTQFAVTIAVAATALPYLSRPVHRLVWFAGHRGVARRGLRRACASGQHRLQPGDGLGCCRRPAPGGGLAAGPAVSAEITAGSPTWVSPVADITRAPRQDLGGRAVHRPRPDGQAIELSVYGRDASDARVLAKLWRFCFYRDSGPTLILDRLQQVEHEAYLTLMAGAPASWCPRCWPPAGSGPAGTRRWSPGCPMALSWRKPTPPPPDEALDDVLAAVLRLREARLAHGALGGDTIIVSDHGHLHPKTSAARPPRPRPAASTATWRQRSPLWPSRRAPSEPPRRRPGSSTPTPPAAPWCTCSAPALDPGTVAGAAQIIRTCCPGCGTAVASAAGIEVPKLAEAKRVSWVNLVFGIGTLIGIWAIIGVLAERGDRWMPSRAPAGDGWR